jgi:hypothetical protein
MIGFVQEELGYKRRTPWGESFLNLDHFCI